MSHHIANRAPIGYEQAIEMPLVAEDIYVEVLIARSRHTVDVVESTHDR